MARLLFKIIIPLLFLVSCSDSSETQGEAARWDPLNVYMVNHISRVHRIIFDKEVWADVTVTYTNSTVTVTLADKIVDSSHGEILAVLNFKSNPQEFVRNDYMTFLIKFHAYLTINPIKAKCCEKY